MDIRNSEASKIFTETHYKLFEFANLYVTYLIFNIFKRSGIMERVESIFVTVDEIIEAFDLEPRSSFIPLTWMLEFLSEQGYIVKKIDDDQRICYKMSKKIPFCDIDGIEKSLLAISKDFLPSCELLRKVAQGYPDFFRGRKSGFDILFTDDKMSRWNQYFSNENSGYAMYNTFGAYGVSHWFPNKKGLVALELGCGTGSATGALLNHLNKCNFARHIQSYILSDISLTFVKMAKEIIDKHITSVPPLVLKRLDINRSFVKQGIDYNSIDIIYGVNVLHVAKNLSFTLKEISHSLQKNGIVVLSECVRTKENSLFFKEFIFNMLNNYTSVKTDSLRPTRGFLSPKHWKNIFEKTRFTNIDMILNTDLHSSLSPSHKVFAMIIKGEMPCSPGHQAVTGD